MNPYVPDKLPIENLDFGRLIKLVGEANSELSRYDGLLQGIVNPSILLSPLTTNEAVLSSKIEGTQATLDEVLEHEAGINSSGEKEKDIQEIKPASGRRPAVLAFGELINIAEGKNVLYM
ncbi:MAG: Fic/DOC family N-terminal domain-containing protein [bacterium]